jgi:cell growth-regulating nucleolar protein
MPSFVCGYCDVTLRKPQIKRHVFNCRNSSYTCIDCSKTFSEAAVKDHTSCVTEAEKYHGQYAKKKGKNTSQSTSNTTTPKGTPTAATTPKATPPTPTTPTPLKTSSHNTKPSTPVITSIPASNTNGHASKDEKTAKRKREDKDDGDAAKKEIQSTLAISVNWKQYDWNKKAKNYLSQSGGSASRYSLESYFVEDMLSQIKPQVELYISQKLKNDTSLIVDGDTVKTDKKK